MPAAAERASHTQHQRRLASHMAVAGKTLVSGDEAVVKLMIVEKILVNIFTFISEVGNWNVTGKFR